MPLGSQESHTLVYDMIRQADSILRVRRDDHLRLLIEMPSEKLLTPLPPPPPPGEGRRRGHPGGHPKPLLEGKV